MSDIIDRDSHDDWRDSNGHEPHPDGPPATKAEVQERSRQAKREAGERAANARCSYRLYRRAGLRRACALRMMLRHWWQSA